MDALMGFPTGVEMRYHDYPLHLQISST